MTELAPLFRDDELDEEDLRLRGAFSTLQTVVTEFLGRTGVSINDLSEEEQQELVDRIDPHLKFELETSQDIYKGMPIVVGGAGAFLMTDSEDALVGAQVTAAGDVITGTVRSVQAYPVPSHETVLNTNLNDGISTHDQSLSAVIIIEGASYHTAPYDDGTHQMSYELEDINVVIPVIYGMDARVADIAL